MVTTALEISQNGNEIVQSGHAGHLSGLALQMLQTSLTAERAPLLVAHSFQKPDHLVITLTQTRGTRELVKTPYKE